MTLQIDPSKWKIKLPMYPPDEVSDNSTNEEYSRCARRGLYKYGLRRGFSGKSWPIQYGLAYHKYREVVELLMIEEESDLTDEIHEHGVGLATRGWEDPPGEHKKSFLNLHRLMLALEMARKKITVERRTGTIVVSRTEDSFDLELPFKICYECGYTEYNMKETICLRCPTDHSVSELHPCRHGGKVDQFVKFVTLNDADMIRDFKTTGRMGPTYTLKFDPNAQLQGYTWAKEELSGRKADGALIETVYNTSKAGPEIFQHYVTFSSGQQIQWMASVMMKAQMIRSMWARVDELGYLAFPQSTNACQDFGGCGYRQACLASSGWEIEQWLENNTIYSHWDFAAPDKEESQV